MAYNVQGIRGFGHRMSGRKSDLSILTPAFVSAGAQNLGGVSRGSEGAKRLTDLGERNPEPLLVSGAAYTVCYAMWGHPPLIFMIDYVQIYIL